jgi:hypothetical protein
MDIVVDICVLICGQMDMSTEKWTLVDMRGHAWTCVDMCRHFRGHFHGQMDIFEDICMDKCSVDKWTFVWTNGHYHGQKMEQTAGVHKTNY